MSSASIHEQDIEPIGKALPSRFLAVPPPDARVTTGDFAPF